MNYYKPIWGNVSIIFLPETFGCKDSVVWRNNDVIFLNWQSKVWGLCETAHLLLLIDNEDLKSKLARIDIEGKENFGR